MLSDKFQLNLLIRISSIPSILNSSEYEDLDEETVKMVGKSRIDHRLINLEKCPIYFLMNNSQQSL